jgi:phage FluMu protein Com
MAKCPNCKKLVNLDSKNESADSRTVRKEVLGSVKKEIMYSCPHCESVLGFGFYFGGLLTGRPK